MNLNTIPNIDIRRARADVLVRTVLKELDDILRVSGAALALAKHPDADDRLRQRVAERLHRLFEREGIEVLSDHDRRTAGLPPRGDDGWTAAELAALEQARLDLIAKPIKAKWLALEP